jgi:protein CpxP
MKKSLLLAVAFAFAAASPSFAQTTPAPTPTAMAKGHHGKHQKTPEQSAEHHTAMLTKKLSLTTDQQAKVKQLLLAQAQEADAIKAKYPDATQRQAMHQEITAGRAKYQAQLQAVLNPDQLSKFAALQQTHQHKNKGERGAQTKVKS